MSDDLLKLIDTPERKERIRICQELARDYPFSDKEFYEYGERMRRVFAIARIPYSAELYRRTLRTAADIAVEMGTTL